MGNSWYETGTEGISQEQQRLDAMAGPGRLWIPGGGQKECVFVDDDPICIHEHNPKMNGNYRNQMTCLQGVYDEVACCQVLGPKSRYYCGYLTVVDCSEWQDQRGNKHQYELRLLQMKMKALKKFRRKKEDRTSVVGTMWNFVREDDRSSTCGDEWEFRREVEMEKMFPFANFRGTKLAEMWAEAEVKPETMERVKRWFQIEPDADGKLPKIIPPFNYFKILEPKTPKETKLYLGAVEKDDDQGSSGGGKSNGGSVKEDQVPF